LSPVSSRLSRGERARGNRVASEVDAIMNVHLPSAANGTRAPDAAVALHGTMMDVPLSVISIVDYAARFHGDIEIVSQTVEGGLHRYTYADAGLRIAQLAHALCGLGVKPGERMGTFAWNGFRHVELYYAVAGIGAVCHTVNPRLFAEQIAYIVAHADDQVIFTDLTFVALLETLAPRLTRVRHYVILTDRAHMPDTTLPGALCYEELLAGRPQTFAWPVLDERSAAAMCYTSGTTGDPKGVLYSHRSIVLHAMAGVMAEATRKQPSSRSSMPIVPMFHVNAWGYPYSAPMIGAKLVLIGPSAEPQIMYDLIESEGVQTSAGVPVVWLRLLAYLEATGKPLTQLRALRVGGSAAPATMIEAYEARGIEVIHGWGMTETSPICTTGSIKAKHRNSDDRPAYQRKAGRAVFGAEMRIVDDAGSILPDDGSSIGELQVRGPWISAGYYADDAATRAHVTADGWFRTGDIASLDRDGYLTIHDRAKDLIKSGGEWISSIDLENAAIEHPDVSEAAAIAIPDAIWAERPMLVLVRRGGSIIDQHDVRNFLASRVAKWWLPDRYEFVDELPRTATGKVSKKTLRERFVGPDA
jgi:fatty-acyl-CoA synthase